MSKTEVADGMEKSCGYWHQRWNDHKRLRVMHERRSASSVDASRHHHHSRRTDKGEECWPHRRATDRKTIERGPETESRSTQSAPVAPHAEAEVQGRPRIYLRDQVRHIRVNQFGIGTINDEERRCPDRRASGQVQVTDEMIIAAQSYVIDWQCKNGRTLRFERDGLEGVYLAMRKLEPKP